MMRFERLIGLFAVLFFFFPCIDRHSEAQAQSATIERFGIQLPASVYNRQPIRRLLETLDRERCDRDAIAELGAEMQKAGFRREAALAFVSFSGSCNGHARSLRSAVNIYLTITDHDKALETATRLIELEPFEDNGYYLRGLTHDRMGHIANAIADYSTAIELFANKNILSSVAYVAIARNFEKLGRMCDAAHILESWVSLNVEKNDTTQSRTMIAKYLQRGQCEAAIGTKTEIFPTIPNQTTTVSLTINGVRGNFIIDTGATYVSVKSSFATKAKIAIDPEISLRLNTANGIVEAARGNAASIKLRGLEARNVAVAIQLDQNATYGSRIDGLLGMSFLSRFRVTMDSRQLRLSPRSGAPAR